MLKGLQLEQVHKVFKEVKVSKGLIVQPKGHRVLLEVHQLVVKVLKEVKEVKEVRGLKVLKVRRVQLVHRIED